MKSILLILLLLGCVIRGNAQSGITGLPFLQIEPTAEGMFTGGAASALPSLHPASFFYNPAHLGHMGYHQTAAISGFHRKMVILPFYRTNLTYNHWSGAGGINLAQQLQIPLSVGLGYIRSDFDLGEAVQVDDGGNVISEFNSSEHYNMFGIGLLLDYPINVSLGYSRKYIVSSLLPKEDYGYAETTASDIGLLLSYSTDFDRLKTSISMSYAIRNIGDDVQYHPDYSDPLPRTAIWGYALSASYVLGPEQFNLKLMQVDWTLEAQDILVKLNQNSESFEINYTQFPGNISFFDNVVLGNDDDQVIVRRGVRFQLMETITIGVGSFKGHGYDTRIASNGYSISSRGIFKQLNQIVDKPFLNKFFGKVNITYSNTNLDESYLTTNRYQGISIQYALF